MPKKRDKSSRELFVDPSGQLRLVDKSAEQEATEEAEVECLGLRFPSEEALRAHFTELLRAKLKDPEFRKTPGFPKGTDENILRLSDPPWYTACPNPFLADFVRVYGKPFDPKERYEREPMAVDVSVGKSDPLYKAHGYHTKVPHLAIVPSILHYTKPGHIVLDGFCGSGMTGVAAQWCGSAPPSYRKELEAQWHKAGREKPEWGVRRAILGDLSPAATSIAAGYNIPFDVEAFAAAAEQLLKDVEVEVGWMYETLHTDGKTKGRIVYTVWSEILGCPECAGAVDFVRNAFDLATGRVRDKFRCVNCGVELDKRRLERRLESRVDRMTGEVVRSPTRVQATVRYAVGGKAFSKAPDSHDVAMIERIAALPLPSEVPVDRMMHVPAAKEGWGDKWRAGTASFTHVNQLFTLRTAHTIAALWRRADELRGKPLQTALKFLLSSHLTNLSIQNRFRPQVSFPYNPLGGVYYIPSAICEASPFDAYRNKIRRIKSAWEHSVGSKGTVMVAACDCGTLGVPADSIDYVFTDPPFGANFAYAELNFLAEAWHRVFTNQDAEAIVSPAQKKAVHEYQELMRLCFSEYYRVLKPGRWMTVVFSNSSNAIWRAIQEAIGTSGFVIGDVRTLDKVQGSFNQVSGATVDQDLIISAYKPPVALAERFALGKVGAESAWAFVREQLRHVPVFVAEAEQAEPIVERTSQRLHDRMVAFHVQGGLAVPLSSADFLAELAARFPERDGMYFLSEQVSEYDKRRAKVSGLRQLELFVNDEASAIQWMRRELQQKPQSFQDLQPAFMRELQAWAKHELTIELKEILKQNCLCYDGVGDVPSQIHAYLSSNYKTLRNLPKDHPRLVEQARDRWYVPDPGRQSDLDRIREQALLREFEAYRTAKERTLKQFRTEAVRAGFKAAYDAGDYQAIVAVARKLPDTVLQEDEKLLMYFDVATMRLGKD